MPEFQSVGKASEFSEGQIKKIVLGGKEIAITKVGDEFFAFQDLCTHDDGPLALGTLEGEAIECPRHGAQFSIRTGEVLRMPASYPIETYPVKIEGGEVKICLESKVAKG